MPYSLQSPLYASSSSRILPSPTSLNLPVPAGIISPSLQPNTAHAAHVQDLQHQVSVKTLGLQTLQREYDSLLQKLERQRTKCATLEKKFEVSDVEINSLTDEKENLERQVETLERQVEDAQNVRDEARKTGADQSAQYMKMIEMAGRLQAKATDDRKKWEQEKVSLIGRIEELESSQSQLASHNLGKSAEHPRRHILPQPKRGTPWTWGDRRTSDPVLQPTATWRSSLSASTTSCTGCVKRSPY